MSFAYHPVEHRFDDCLNDAALDVAPLALEQLDERVAAAVLPRSGRHPVGDREDGGLHTGAFVFSSRRTPSTTISLSTALAMS